jgi:hypothetical protein
MRRTRASVAGGFPQREGVLLEELALGVIIVLDRKKGDGPIGSRQRRAELLERLSCFITR